MNLKILWNIILLLIFTLCSYAQVSWNDHYLFPYQIEQSEEEWNKHYNYSLIGEQQKVHTLQSPPYKDAISANDSLEVSGCYTADISTIYKTIKNYNVVIVNEKHHVPADRLFMIPLLDSLYQLGFRHLGMESLWHKTIEGFQKDKYQKISTGNYYSLEPRFGELVRRALEMNYEVFPYETDSNTMWYIRSFHHQFYPTLPKWKMNGI